MKKSLLFILFCFTTIFINGQVGGKTIFSSLSVSDNARVAAQGGYNVSIIDDDVNRFIYNPAALNDGMLHSASINYLPFVADIKKTTLAGYFDLKKYGKWGFAFTNMSYGKFNETDVNGNLLAEFKAADNAFILSKAFHSGNYALGANLTLATSTFSRFSSTAIMFDLGGTWKHPKKDFSVGMVFKNVGLVLSKYTPNVQHLTPFDIQLGLSYKLEHMPLRFSITAHKMHVFDIVYLDPERQTTFTEDGDEISLEKTFFDNVFRHFVFGGEFVFSKGFHARVGYNVLRRRELRLESTSGGSGFSFGFMMRVKKLEFNFTRIFYHVSGGRTALTLTTKLNTLFKKKSVKENTHKNAAEK